MDLVFSSEGRQWPPGSFFSIFSMIYLFTQRKAAVCGYSLRNKIQTCTRQGCVINSSSHKGSGRSIKLASLQGTWLRLVLALGEWLYVLESEVVLFWALLGFYGVFSFHMRKWFIALFSMVPAILQWRCLCLCICAYRPCPLVVDLCILVHGHWMKGNVRQTLFLNMRAPQQNFQSILSLWLSKIKNLKQG